MWCESVATTETNNVIIIMIMATMIITIMASNIHIMAHYDYLNEPHRANKASCHVCV